MDTFKERGRVRALVVAGALAAALALPLAVNADTTGGSGGGGATISVDPVIHVQGKVLATINATFTCDPFLTYDWETGTYVETTEGHVEFGEATITQAQGRSIATGTGSVSGPGVVVCDGATSYPISYDVVATTMPWKNGTAVAGASIYIVDKNASTSDGAGSGLITVKLAGK